MRIIAGNWKMNLNAAQARALVGDLLNITALSKIGDAPVATQVWIAPTFTSLWAAREAMGGSTALKLGAQDVHWASSGAYTGEISPPMLAEVGCSFCLVGHSERRTLFGERGEILTKKLNALSDAGITPLFCIGETMQERQEGKTLEVLKKQLAEELFGAEMVLGSPKKPALPVVVAYEPVWAIGTGLVAKPEDIAAAHKFVREQLEGAGYRDVPILYGGSVAPGNSQEILAVENVDGALVGGASLKAETFGGILAG